MIGEKISIGGKDYEIKKDIKMGIYRKLNLVNQSLVDLARKYGNDKEFDELEQDQIQKIMSEYQDNTGKQLQLVLDFLEDVLEITQDQIDNMTQPECMDLFRQTFKSCTEVKKKPKVPSDS